MICSYDVVIIINICVVVLALSVYDIVLWLGYGKR